MMKKIYSFGCTTVSAALLCTSLTAGSGQAHGEPGRSETAPRPQRIVSLNLCADQLLHAFGFDSRIAALSYLSTDPQYSVIAEDARKFRTVRGSAEELVAIQPDLVIAGPYTTKTTVAMLQRLGKRVLILPIATNFAQLRSNIASVGEALGEPGRAAELIRAFDRRLLGLKRRVTGKRPRAAVYYTNSVTQIAGSIESEVLKFSGYRNIAEELRLSPRGTLELERLLQVVPDMIVLGHRPEDYKTVLADNLRHPALGNYLRNHAWVAIEERLWICGTPVVLDAAEKLIHAWEKTTRGDRP